MSHFFEKLTFYLITVNVATFASSIITYTMLHIYGLEAEANPIMRFVFNKVGLTVGLFLKHVYLTSIGTLIFYYAAKNNHDFLIWVYVVAILFDSVFCIASLVKFLSIIFYP